MKYALIFATILVLFVIFIPEKTDHSSTESLTQEPLPQTTGDKTKATNDAENPNFLPQDPSHLTQKASRNDQKISNQMASTIKEIIIKANILDKRTLITTTQNLSQKDLGSLVPSFQTLWEKGSYGERLKLLFFAKKLNQPEFFHFWQSVLHEPSAPLREIHHTGVEGIFHDPSVRIRVNEKLLAIEALGELGLKNDQNAYLLLSNIVQQKGEFEDTPLLLRIKAIQNLKKVDRKGYLKTIKSLTEKDRLRQYIELAASI